jgi:hypothetical protein
MALFPGEPRAATDESAGQERLRFRVAVSERLLLLSVALQAVDVLVMILAVRRGFFTMGRGPLGRLAGLSPAAVWIIMKSSAFLVLILAAMRGTRLVILALNAWFVAFDLVQPCDAVPGVEAPLVSRPISNSAVFTIAWS